MRVGGRKASVRKAKVRGKLEMNKSNTVGGRGSRSRWEKSGAVLQWEVGGRWLRGRGEVKQVARKIRGVKKGRPAEKRR